MKNNNNNNQQSLGLVDSPAFSKDDTLAYLHRDELAALENTFPSGKPINDDRNNNNSFVPGVHRPQVQQQLNYEQWEQKVLREQRENFNNRTSLYNQSPVNSGAPNLPANNKTTSEGLAKACKEHQQNELANKLAFVSNNITRLEKQLANFKAVKKTIEKNLKGLDKE